MQDFFGRATDFKDLNSFRYSDNARTVAYRLLNPPNRARAASPSGCPGAAPQEVPNMFCDHSTKSTKPRAKRASPLEISYQFEHERETLSRLAFLIMGDKGAAELSVSEARELAMNGANPFPFREQLTEWVKWVTIKAVIKNSLDEIACCGPSYVYQNCAHAQHLLNGNGSKLLEFRNFLLQIDPELIIAELDPLARAVAILRTTGRASILDCILRLRLSLDTVLAANCRAMTWFAEKRTGLTDKAPTPRQKLEKP